MRARLTVRWSKPPACHGGVLAGIRAAVAFLLLSAASHAQTAPATLDRVAVVVGKDVITATEVVQEVRLEAFLNNAPLNLSPENRRAAAERLVDQQLIRNEMRVGAYPQPEPAEVDNMLKSLKQDRFPTDREFHAALDRYGITEEQLRNHLAWQLAAIRFTDLRFGGAPAAEQGSTDHESANRAAPAADVDQRLDAWLKQTRAETKIQFKEGAFQ
jgi:hypothetical protein